MRPYITIIRDSFHEAFESKTLWVLLVLLTALLLVAAPFKLYYVEAASVEPENIRNASAIIEVLQNPGDSALDQKLSTIVKQENLTNEIGVAVELNRIIGTEDLYDSDLWSGYTLTAEAKELTENADLGNSERDRLNRLLVQARFSAALDPPAGRELDLAWGPYGQLLPQELRAGLSGPSIKEKILDQAVLAMMGIFVGMIGVFTAILVTSNVVPKTFEPGAIDLLLSKPVRRPLLFLSKYLGGCAFILILGAYFTAGMWLILGIRMDYWAPRILLTIPVFVFLFAIYYSVSALAGLIWRNAIISIALTILFWFVCISMAITKSGMEVFITQTATLSDAIVLKEQSFGNLSTGRLETWDNATQSRVNSRLSESDGNQDGFNMSSLIASADGKAAYGVAAPRNRGRVVNFFGGDDSTLAIASKETDWRWVTGPTLGRGFSNIVTAGPNTVMWAEARGLRKATIGAYDPIDDKIAIDVQSMLEDVRMTPPLFAAIDSQGNLAVSNLRGLNTFSPDGEGGYELTNTYAWEGDFRPQTISASVGKIALGYENGVVEIRDANTLEVTRKYTPDGENNISSVSLSPDGKTVAIVSSTNRAWYQPTDTDELARRHSDIQFAKYSNGDLVVGDFIDRVRVYESAGGAEKAEFAPKLGTFRKIYHYVVSPLYTVFPKPSEIGNIASYLITGKETVEVPVDATNPNSPTKQMKISVWGPLWSSFAFVVFILGIGCFRIWRKDF